MGILREKSKENSIIADIASKKEFYHVAISRQYYSLFQLIIYFIETFHSDKFEKIKNKYADDDGKILKGSHELRIETIIKVIKENRNKYNVGTSEIHAINKLVLMKSYRKKSDYKTIFIDEEMFDKNNRLFFSIQRTLDRAIKKEENYYEK